MAWLLWLALGVALLIAEALSLSFVAAYFGIGAIGAALIAALGAPVWLQLAEFLAVSIALLLLTRNLVLAMAHQPAAQATNVNTLAGRAGIVTIAIDNDASTGQIRIGGEYWTARTLDDSDAPIPEGARVEVVEVAGVTARVRPRPALEPAQRSV